MRVLLATAATSTKGGGEKHVADLMRLLVARGVEVGLVAPPGGDLAELCAELGVAYCAVEIESGFTLRAVREVREAIADFVPDVVHAHGSRAAAFVRFADPKASRRVVYTLHGIHIDKAGSRLRQVAFLTLERYLRPRTARFITVARSDIAKGARLGILDASLTRTVYNGIAFPSEAPPQGAFRDELGLAADVPLAVCIGRFHEQKDHATLLAAFALVRQAHPEAHLALVGGGDLEGSLRERSVALGLGAAVHFVAPRADMQSVYADADLVVLSSLWEGLPYVVLEAAAYRVPVVATCVDGIPEAVEDGVSGLLVPVRDPDAMAAAIETLLGDPERRRAMGEAGRKRVERDFGLERMADELVEVYSEAAEGKSTS